MENPIDAPRLPRKRRSLAQERVIVLSEQIRDGHLKRGDKLPTESAIMDVHGVSRTVVTCAMCWRFWSCASALKWSPPASPRNAATPQRRSAEQLALMRDALDALNESAAHDDQQHYMNRLSREHEEIYEAIARQDSEAARAACVYI